MEPCGEISSYQLFESDKKRPLSQALLAVTEAGTGQAGSEGVQGSDAPV